MKLSDLRTLDSMVHRYKHLWEILQDLSTEQTAWEEATHLRERLYRWLRRRSTSIEFEHETMMWVNDDGCQEYLVRAFNLPRCPGSLNVWKQFPKSEELAAAYVALRTQAIALCKKDVRLLQPSAYHLY